MAFRRPLIHHDGRLRYASTGLALANELDTCLTVRRLGHRLIYRPEALVDHFTTSYRDPHLGSRVAGADVITSAANYTYALLKYLPPHRRIAFLALRLPAGLIDAARAGTRAVRVRRKPATCKGDGASNRLDMAGQARRDRDVPRMATGGAAVHGPERRLAMAVLPVSVVVPTIGRPAQLERCLESLLRCEPQPAEILVIDQSAGHETAEAVARFARIGARTVPCAGRGISLAMNLGLREAGHPIVLVTHDDCRVDASWVAVAHRLMSEQPDGIVTGRVLPLGDPTRVPSTRDDPRRRDYSGELHVSVLSPHNMALNRSRVIEVGGFDEHFRAAAEDCDLCYRWLRAGNGLRYEPGMVVWHDDWRDDAQLDRLHTYYQYWLAFFYAKHLRGRDLAVVRFVVRSFYWWLHGAASWAIRRRPQRSSNPRWFLRGFPSGFRDGWRAYGPRGR